MITIQSTIKQINKFDIYEQQQQRILKSKMLKRNDIIIEFGF